MTTRDDTDLAGLMLAGLRTIDPDKVDPPTVEDLVNGVPCRSASAAVRRAFGYHRRLIEQFNDMSTRLDGLAQFAGVKVELECSLSEWISKNLPDESWQETLLAVEDIEERMATTMLLIDLVWSLIQLELKRLFDGEEFDFYRTHADWMVSGHVRDVDLSQPQILAQCIIFCDVEEGRGVQTKQPHPSFDAKTGTDHSGSGGQVVWLRPPVDQGTRH